MPPKKAPIHYTDDQINKMLAAVHEADPYGKAHNQKGAAWDRATQALRDSGAFSGVELTAKGVQDKIRGLLKSHEKPSKTVWSGLQARVYDSQIDSLRRLQQDAQLNRQAATAREHQREERLRNEGQAARKAALSTFRAEHQSRHTEATGSDTNSKDEGSEHGAEAGPPAVEQVGPNTSALVVQIRKSLQQINQTEGARFERMFGAVVESNRVAAESAAATHDLARSVRDLVQVQAEANAMFRATLALPQPPVPVPGILSGPAAVLDGPPFPPPPLQTPGAGPSQKRARMDMDE